MYIINSSPTQNGLIKMGCAATGPAPADGRTTSERSQVQVLLLGPIRLLSRQTALRRRFKNHQLDRRRFVGAAFCLLIWWAQCAYLVGPGAQAYSGTKVRAAVARWLVGWIIDHTIGTSYYTNFSVTCSVTSGV